MVLLIDNYDSFSYNLVQLTGEIRTDIKVIRNDEMSVEEIKSLNPEYIILSPGPGRPSDAGVCESVVKEMKGKCRILGVCLGHQSICEAFGGEIIFAKEIMHGKQSNVWIDNTSQIFKDLPERIDVARYHSLVAARESLPEELKVISVDDNGELMAVKHKNYEIYGLQFHPESILTPMGKQILKNFLTQSG